MFYIQISYTNGHGVLAYRGTCDQAKEAARVLVGGVFAGRAVVRVWIASANGEVFEV